MLMDHLALSSPAVSYTYGTTTNTRSKRIESPLWMDNANSLDPGITSLGSKYKVFQDTLSRVLDDDKPKSGHRQNIMKNFDKAEGNIMVINGHNFLPDHAKGEDLFNLVNPTSSLILDCESEGEKVTIISKNNDLQDRGKDGDKKEGDNLSQEHDLDKETTMLTSGINSSGDHSEIDDKVIPDYVNCDGSKHEGNTPIVTHGCSSLQDRGKYENKLNGGNRLQVSQRGANNKKNVTRGLNLPRGLRSSLMSAIKSCAKRKDLEEAKKLHLEALQMKLFPEDVYVSTAILTMYTKCGALGEAQKVFDELRVKDVVSWSALICGYVQHGFHDKALKCFQQMQDEHVSPNDVTFICIVKACGRSEDVEMGREIHAQAKKLGLLGKNASLGTAFVDMYAKCGLLGKAREAFEELPRRDVVAWTALIAGYAQRGLGSESLKCFARMRDEGIRPNAITFMAILQACAGLGYVELAKEIHEEAKRMGCLGKELALSTTLMGVYFENGAVGKVREVFDGLIERDVVAWNALISGYSDNGLGREALECFRRMLDEGVSPDAITFTCALKGCSSIGCLGVGEEIHAGLWSGRWLGTDALLGNALVDMYARHGAVARARDAFEELPERNLLSWNALIGGYVQKGLSNEALKCFREMRREGLRPDSATFLCIARACASSGSIEVGEEILGEVQKRGLFEREITLGAAFVEMYMKCGFVGKAQQVFKELLPARDAAVCNALMVGYAQRGLNDRVVEHYAWMREMGINPDGATFACVLRACASRGTLEMVEEIDAEVRRKGLLAEADCMLGKTLVDVYSKHGRVREALRVFGELRNRDAVAWGTLISGYAQIGDAETVLRLFRRMTAEGGFAPNRIVFLALLVACSHRGLIEEGRRIFDEMMGVFGLAPGIQHYTCMVDLFGRAGHFVGSIAVLEMVPASDRLPPLLSLLGACQKWVNLEIGRWAFSQSLDLDAACSVAYLCMVNICASFDRAEHDDEPRA